MSPPPGPVPQKAHPLQVRTPGEGPKMSINISTHPNTCPKANRCPASLSYHKGGWPAAAGRGCPPSQAVKQRFVPGQKGKGSQLGAKEAKSE